MLILLVLFSEIASYVSAGQLPAEVRTLNQTIINANPGFSISQAKAYAIELIPLIEEASGRRFENIPEIRLVNTNELNAS